MTNFNPVVDILYQAGQKLKKYYGNATAFFGSK